MPIKNEPATPCQIEFVRGNMQQMTLKQMGALLDKSITEVFRIVQQINREARKEDGNQPRPVERTFHADEPTKIVRPPAIYTNRSHEETIDYWMNLQV
jgi:hypothetical protein